MANNVYDRFREELLVQKDVKLAPDIFSKYHREIFPNADAFIGFLQPQMHDDTVTAAKELYDLLQFSLICPMPKVYSDSLLHVESATDDLADNFIAQDHYVHSIYLYLTGIYVFFNHRSIHEQITAQMDWVNTNTENPFSDPYCEKVKAFVRMWKYFALYHDIGYSFEKPLKWFKKKTNEKVMHVDPRAKLDADFFEAFNKPEDYISYELSIKVLSSYLLYVYITNHSKGTAADLEIHTTDSWTILHIPSGETESSSSEEVTEKLSKLSSYICLSKVSTYRNLAELIPFVDTAQIVTAAFTNHGKLCAIKTPDCVFYHNENCDLNVHELMKLELLGSNEAADRPYYCEYFYYEEQNRKDHLLQELGIFSYDRDIPVALETIIDESSMTFSMLTKTSDLRIVRYTLFKYLRTFVPLTSFGAKNETHLKNLHRQNIQDAYRTAIRNAIQQHHAEMEQQDTLSKLNDDEYIECALVALLKMMSTLEPSIVKKELDHSKERRLATIQILLDLLRIMQSKIKGIVPINIPLIDCSKEDVTLFVNIRPLGIRNIRNKTTPAYKHHRECFIPLVSKLLDFLSELGFLKDAQKLDTFLSYIPRHTCVDHGIVSASLLANCLLVHQVIGKNMMSSSQNSSVLVALAEGSPLSIIDREIGMIWDTALFSILIHNIYGNDYADQVKLRYMQRLDVNAFSYLGALCDSLQFWDRPRQFNPAISNSGKVYYAGNSDIEVNGDCIVVTCTSKDAYRESWDRKQNLREFLQDADHIVHLNITESI